MLLNHTAVSPSISVKHFVYSEEREVKMQIDRAEEDACDSVSEQYDSDTLADSTRSPSYCNKQRFKSSDVSHRNKRDVAVKMSHDAMSRKMTSESGRFTSFRVDDILRPSTSSAERKPGKHTV